MAATKLSSELYHALQGVFCVYKPPHISTSMLARSLKLKLSNEMNKLPLNAQQSAVVNQYGLTELGNLADRHISPKAFGLRARRLSNISDARAESVVTHQESPSASSEQEVQVLSKEFSPLNMEPADVQFHPSVLGGLWRVEDFVIKPLDMVSPLTSGVLPFAVGKQGKKDMTELRAHNPIKVYRVTAQLGIATSNFQVSGGILEKVDHRHVTQPLIDRLLSAIQATHQKLQYVMAGVDVQSQEAYELASRGLVRPAPSPSGRRCVLYSIKSVEWKPPELLIEIHTVNETGPYIVKLIHDIGQELRCGAVCTAIRRIRVGHFDTTHSLVNSQWNSHEIITNIETCREPLALTMTDRLEQLAALEASQLISSSKTMS
ncbi:pseudouridylate synthase TRUB2, mitochondrial-like [Watersipora subatra]|uniref:pseudouridylate synthase TRUB2, mitochondrial-like n=1 Tax=Watersipora subatra TaxID=2589382 RepID=UPI00355B38DE